MRERQNGKDGGQGSGQPAAGSRSGGRARDCRHREDIKGAVRGASSGLGFIQ